MNIIINLIHIITLPLGLGWTCQLLVAVPLLYTCDVINAAIIIASTLIQYKDEFGIVQDSPKQTMKKMMMNGGALQLASLIPWDFIPLVIASSQGECHAYDTNYRIWIYVRALKIIPALHSLLKASLLLTVPYVKVQVGRLIKSIIGLLLLVHMSACFFFSLSGSQETEKSWVYKVIIKENSATSMINQSTYYAMGVFVFNNRECQTDVEWIYSIFELIVAAIIYGAFFGMINSILKTSINNESILRKKQFKFRYRQIHSYMCENHFPKQLQDEIKRHEKIKFHHMDGIDEKMVWHNLPKDLHQEIVMFLYGQILNSISIFQDHDHGFISALSLVIEPIHVACDTLIFKVGDEARDMYIVLKGVIEITTPSVFSGESVVRTSQIGSYFGEVALLRNEVREVSARTITDCDLGRISRKNLEVLLMRFPEAKAKMLRKVEDKIRQTITASLQSNQGSAVSRQTSLQKMLSFSKK